MSIQQPPFVVRRPDGFIGVEVAVDDQLTVEDARLLAWQLLVTARLVEIGEERAPIDPPAWLVWEKASDGGRPHLRAVDLSEERAQRHVAYLKREAPYYRPPRPEPDLVIEETRLDHLYAANLIAALMKRNDERRNGKP